MTDKVGCFLNGVVEQYDMTTCTDMGGIRISLSQNDIIQAINEMCIEVRGPLFELTEFNLYSVCEGDFLFVTLSETKYNNFISYSGTGAGFEQYRTYYMTNLGDSLVSSFVLDACVVDTDCATGETCVANKCDGACVPGTWSPSTSTIECGVSFYQVDNVCGNSRQVEGTKGCSTGSSDNTMLWIFGGIAVLLFMGMMGRT